MADVTPEHDQKTAVQRQFGASVAGYVTSAVHARGEDLAQLADIAGLTGSELVLDVATAVGHAAFALAPRAREVIGVDLTEGMLVEARRQAELRGVTNVRFQTGDAEALPFPDATFDVVLCRIAAHHFPSVPAFCRESVRVLREGGRLVVVDNIAPEDDELDRFINDVERMRDPSHVREYRLTEWEQFFRDAGLAYEVALQLTMPIDREDWLRRMNVPDDVAIEVRQRLADAPGAARTAFEITETHFQLYKAVLVGRR
jgi:SAM-dependent methyltransferase